MTFSGYILSIVGVVIVGVIIDLMLVEGQMQKYIKNIFVVFVIFVVIAPVPTLLNLNIRLPSIPTSTIQTDQNFIKNINQQKASQLENDILSHFSQNGVSNVKVTVSIDDTASEFLPKEISLNIKKLVIENNYLNINKYEVLRELVLDIVKVQEETIVFYE